MSKNGVTILVRCTSGDCRSIGPVGVEAGYPIVELAAEKMKQRTVEDNINLFGEKGEKSRRSSGVRRKKGAAP